MFLVTLGITPLSKTVMKAEGLVQKPEKNYFDSTYYSVQGAGLSCACKESYFVSDLLLYYKGVADVILSV